jgi:hypothetical protein
MDSMLVEEPSEYDQLWAQLIQLDNGDTCPSDLNVVFRGFGGVTYCQKLETHLSDLACSSGKVSYGIIDFDFLFEFVLDPEQIKLVNFEARTVWEDQSVTLYGVKCSYRQLWRALYLNVSLRANIVEKLITLLKHGEK